MKQKRIRSCQHCNELFRPDHRNGHHQRYCPATACRAASKVASQRRWLSRTANRNYHCGNDAVERVRQWRKAHPGYWRRKQPPLQDVCQSQPIENENLSGDLAAEISPKALPLQDLCLAKDPLFVGLMAHLTGALQDDIETQLLRFHSHGMTILRKGPGIETENDHACTQAGAV